MSDLSTLLKDASQQARNYADARLAVASAQRIRKTTAAVAAVVILGLLAGGMWVWQRHEPERPGGLPVRSHPLYPPVVTASDQSPMLPASAVGPASFIYMPCLWGPACPRYLVFPDGTQYQLPGTDDMGYSLSPDGRYLGWAEGNRFRLRDLQGDAVVDVHVPGQGNLVRAARWSPNGRYVVVARSGENVLRTFVRVALDGSAQVVTIPHDDTPTADGDEILGVLDTGEIVALPGHSYPYPDHLLVLDALSGKENRRIPVDKAGISVAGGVTPGGVELLIAPCGCEVDFLLRHPLFEFAADTGLPSVDKSVVPVSPTVILGVMRVDATGSGRVLGRVDLPRPVLDRRQARFTSAWSIRADLPEGFVAVNWRTDATELALVDRVTGARNVVSRLPAQAVIMLRGNTFFE